MTLLCMCNICSYDFVSIMNNLLTLLYHSVLTIQLQNIEGKHHEQGKHIMNTWYELRIL